MLMKTYKIKLKIKNLLNKMSRQSLSIAEIASNNKKFQILTSLLQKANLVDTLSNNGNFTVFAPTDVAFRLLSRQNPDLFNAVLTNTDVLKQILLYHVLPYEVYGQDITTSPITIETLQGKCVSLFVDTNQKVRVNNATVIQSDIIARNGIVHVIDQVLTPLKGCNSCTYDL